MTQKAKLFIYRSVSVPALTYGHELWVTTRRERSKQLNLVSSAGCWGAPLGLDICVRSSLGAPFGMCSQLVLLEGDHDETMLERLCHSAGLDKLEIVSGKREKVPLGVPAQTENRCCPTFFSGDCFFVSFLRFYCYLTLILFSIYTLAAERVSDWISTVT